jgi:UDP-N-acetylglucosamine 2-epimerase
MGAIRVTTIVGARPQFIKAAAVSRAFTAGASGIFDERIVHTGQHYDENMSRVFFEELKVPRPHVNLGIGSGTHGVQTGAMLEQLEPVLAEHDPDWVLIYGDTNSTLAGALVAAKLGLRVAHVEAGLRSYNRTMPEEINRVLADRVSTLLLCPTRQAVDNLAREGVVDGVELVGDVMYDSVLFNADIARQHSDDVLRRLSVQPRGYYLATVHRAENTDDPARLAGILDAIATMDHPIVLPLHPRTRAVLGDRLDALEKTLQIVPPVPYLEMLTLERNARLILTDSGGVQKEAYWFDVPCVTLRDETEWVELVEAGCNKLAGARTEVILEAVGQFERNDARLPSGRPGDLYGDGCSAICIAQLLAERAAP